MPTRHPVPLALVLVLTLALPAAAQRVPPAPAGVDLNVDAVRTGDSRTLLETEKLRAALQAQRQRCERERLGVKRARQALARAEAARRGAAHARLRRRQHMMAAACTA